MVGGHAAGTVRDTDGHPLAGAALSIGGQEIYSDPVWFLIGAASSGVTQA